MNFSFLWSCGFSCCYFFKLFIKPFNFIAVYSHIQLHLIIFNPQSTPIQRSKIRKSFNIFCRIKLFLTVKYFPLISFYTGPTVLDFIQNPLPISKPTIIGLLKRLCFPTVN